MGKSNRNGYAKLMAISMESTSSDNVTTTNYPTSPIKTTKTCEKSTETTPSLNLELDPDGASGFYNDDHEEYENSSVSSYGNY
jgi:hypothetical protein